MNRVSKGRSIDDSNVILTHPGGTYAIGHWFVQSQAPQHDPQQWKIVVGVYKTLHRYLPLVPQLPSPSP